MHEKIIQIRGAVITNGDQRLQEIDVSFGDRPLSAPIHINTLAAE